MMMDDGWMDASRFNCGLWISFSPLLLLLLLLRRGKENANIRFRRGAVCVLDAYIDRETVRRERKPWAARQQGGRIARIAGLRSR